ncbi:MAG TPA: response regulator [Pyrinomonadaceae bacterium]|nr:response regulator [Pyrinomonadaceae bacterium]
MNSESPSPASSQSALAIGNSPATDHRRYQVTEPAPLFQADAGKQSSQTSIDELSRLLGSLIGQGNGASVAIANATRPSWDPRKILICTNEQYRQGLAQQLSQNGYQVFVAQDTRQAIERMRENRIDVVLLDQEFDPLEQGAAFVTREVTVLRPAQRRRLFFVLLSPVLRTMEAHAAFLNNVNAIVNIKDVADAPRILELALREYNELYKEFNLAINVSGL